MGYKIIGDYKVIPGFLGNAVDLQGKAYIDTGINKVNSDGLTLSFMYKYNPTNIKGDKTFFNIKKSDDVDNYLLVWINDDKDYCTLVYNENNNMHLDKLSFLKDGKWHMITFTFNGNIYVDSNKIYENLYNLNPKDITSNIIIGADRDSGNLINDFSYDCFDEICLFDKNLSDDEVKQLYDYILNKNSNNTIEQLNPIAYIDFNNNYKDIENKITTKLEGNENYCDTNGEHNLPPKAFNFDGNTIIQTNYNSKNIVQNGTISLWVKADPKNNKEYVEILGYRKPSSSKYLFSFYWVNKLNKFWLMNSSGDEGVAAEYEGINDIINQWTHIAGTFDNNVMKLYINGKYINQKTLPNSTGDNGDIMIGWSGYNDKFKGCLSDLAIFDKVLTSKKIEELYLNGQNSLYPTDHLIACYNFENNANDNCGNYNGTWINGEDYGDGINGKCAKFNNKNYITINSDIIKNFNNEYFSVSMLLKDNDPTDRSDCAFDNKYFSIWNKQVYIYTDNKGQTSGSYYIYKTIKDTDWHNIVVIKNINDGSDFKIYLDGKLLADKNTTPDSKYDPSYNYNYDNLTIGAEHYNGNYSSYFNGFIDDIKIYNKELSENEIKQLYDYYKIENILKFLVVDLNGKTIKNMNDLSLIKDYINQGYNIFTPRTSDEYYKALEWMENNGYENYYPFMPAIYYEKDGPGCCDWEFKDYNINELYTKGWKSSDGYNKWEIPNTGDITEPNGDYRAYDFLQRWEIDKNSKLVSHYNDNLDDYARPTKILLVKRY